MLDSAKCYSYQCIDCGATFEGWLAHGRGARRKRCPPCAKSRFDKYQQTYRDALPRKGGLRKHEPHPCAQCGELIPQSISRGRRKEYCRPCIVERSKIYRVDCCVCGKSFQANYAKAKACSVECGHKIKSIAAGWCGTKRNCAVCQKEFEIRSRNQKCCGIECSQHLAGYKALVRQQQTFKCEHCGKGFPRHRSSRTANRFCSRLCAFSFKGFNVANPQKEAASVRRISNTHKDRAKRFGRKYEAINISRIFERDEWKCGICSEPVDKELKWPHPDSASLDHKLALVDGGDHVPENVQCAHLRCNLKKERQRAETAKVKQTPCDSGDVSQVAA